MGTVVGVLGHQRVLVTPRLINVENNVEGFADGFSIMEQNRDFLVNWVGFEEEVALVEKVFFFVFVLNTLFC